MTQVVWPQEDNRKQQISTNCFEMKLKGRRPRRRLRER